MPVILEAFLKKKTNKQTNQLTNIVLIPETDSSITDVDSGDQKPYWNRKVLFANRKQYIKALEQKNQLTKEKKK